MVRAGKEIDGISRADQARCLVVRLRQAHLAQPDPRIVAISRCKLVGSLTSRINRTSTSTLHSRIHGCRQHMSAAGDDSLDACLLVDVLDRMDVFPNL